MTLPDTDSLDTYGGALANYAEVEDPTTDEDADYRNKYAANVAMMTVTAPRAIVTFVGHATTPADPASGFVHAALWGSGPSVKPVVTRVGGTGHYLITYPATVDDPLAVEHTLNFRRAYAQVESAGVMKHAAAEVTSANTVTVYTYLANGTLDNLATANITCWIY